METVNSWCVVEFETTQENEELGGWVMMQECGATACEVKPAGDGRIFVQATYDRKSFPDTNLSSIATVLVQHQLISDESGVRSHDVQQQDWLAKWKEGFKPFEVGERLLVCPIWLEDTLTDADRQRKVFLMEPGMAFGTGLHATTQYCLQRIESDHLGPSILDVGTGSGILAIAAAMLDSNVKVVAIDNDPVAIEVATENCRLNDVESRVKLIAGTTDDVSEESFDDILSNITAEDIVSLLPEYKRLLKSGGSVVCAGVLATKRVMIEEAAREQQFSVEDARLVEPWCGLLLRKK